MDHILITNKENENVSYTGDHFAELTGLYNKSCDMFLRTIIESQERLNSGMDLAFHRVFLAMSMKINSDVRTIMSATRMGWYGTSHALFREINDSIVTISLIVREPNYASMIIKEELSNKAIKRYAKKLKIIEGLAGRDWGKLSRLKHAEGVEILEFYGRNINSKIQFRFVPKIDENHVKFISIYACGLLIRAVSEYRDFHISKYGSDPDIRVFLNEIEEVKQEIITLMA